MISAKIDYLTISLLPHQSGWTISEALGMYVPFRPRSGRGLDKFLRLWYNHQ